MKAKISLKKTIYPESRLRAKGTSFGSTIEVEGKNFGTPPTTGLHNNGTITGEIDRAFRRFIEVQINSEIAADVTVELPGGYELPETLKQHYADKYSIEPEIKSVTFV
ncbi:hypothetical protein Q0N12_16420 [Rossellomorea marisflavi]|uniref:hypothetical protein n=1 Tax=Rossellomorea marisflavi TaxID=189381 RepID=UPI00345B2C4F